MKRIRFVVSSLSSLIAGLVLTVTPVASGSSPLQVTTTAIANGTQNAVYMAALGASGGQPPYTWSLMPGSASLPPDLSLGTNGIICGTPSGSGTTQFIVLVTDAASATASQLLSVTVNASAIPPVIHLTAPSRSANGRFQFAFNTASGVSYTVSYSTNLADSSWTSILSFVGSGGPFTVVDPSATGGDRRYYRVQTQQYYPTDTIYLSGAVGNDATYVPGDPTHPARTFNTALVAAYNANPTNGTLVFFPGETIDVPFTVASYPFQSCTIFGNGSTLTTTNNFIFEPSTGSSFVLYDLALDTSSLQVAHGACPVYTAGSSNSLYFFRCQLLGGTDVFQMFGRFSDRKDPVTVVAEDTTFTSYENVFPIPGMFTNTLSLFSLTRCSFIATNYGYVMDDTYGPVIQGAGVYRFNDCQVRACSSVWTNHGAGLSVMNSNAVVEWSGGSIVASNQAGPLPDIRITAGKLTMRGYSGPGSLNITNTGGTIYWGD
jgi:hypothetical protein